ncbi:type II toxin-antitoxin system toxin DNA ADP-ribosyl transferase DarT [Priestia flexa]|uniref:type II toxin-antitoxin system toxin DNA ADP-ribosyl transferase DarT n=1 Tax=Priestia flexa TaxID=86664 RepID=UPI001CD6E224|nr:DUF4433 domain-containing protein [Priestia flexa]MCA1202403.1 DUF4433 domain-containing protein [Priestia flexa]
MTEEKLLYHITDINNLDSILQQGGLLANSIVKDKGVEYENIAHTNIQDRRLTTNVPLHPNGNLHEYVPFYFSPRSPMLYAIHKGRVEKYEKGQSQIIYLVSRTDIIHNAGLEYVFTDGHAIMWFTEFYKDLKNLDKIDWDVMASHYWSDTPEDPDRRRRRQAEFLVHNIVPIDLFLGIAVKNEEMKQKVLKVLNKYNFDKLVLRKGSWYY